jgi:hypothetical protein
MEKMLLICGIVLIIACVLSLLFAGLNLFGYYHMLDGTAELYSRLHRQAILFLMIGIALAVVGAVCLVTHSRI